MRKIVIVLTATMGAFYGEASSLSSWSSYDASIEALYADTQSESVRLPPGQGVYELSVDAVPFVASAFPEITSGATAEMIMGVSAWRICVYETDTPSRIFVTEVNGVRVHTKTVASYDAQAWSKAVYGNPPSWMTGTELTAWYSDRRRDRMRFRMTLVPTESYSTYLQNLATASSGSGTGSGLPSKPADPNNIAFAQLSPNVQSSGLGFQMYAPKDMTVNIFGKKKLDDLEWKFLGSIEASSMFTPASFGVAGESYFLRAERGDVDSDGDGIPDGLELYHFHTNPYKWDSGNSGVSDGAKLYNLGLAVNSRDTDADGYDDDEEIAAGMNPKVQNVGSGNTIRYYYDEDDRLLGVYMGSNAGGLTSTLSPAGNTKMVLKRSSK